MKSFRPFLLFGLFSFFLGASRLLAQKIPADYQEVLHTLNRSGDFKASVLKVNIPCNDLHVRIAGRETATPFGLGGWIGLTKADGGMDVMMGDLVLTQEEVNPVLSALLDHGIEVTALHNHFFWDEPRLFFLHVHAHGKAAELARSVKPALDLIGRGAASPANPAPAAPATPALDIAALTKIIGHAGERLGAVQKFTVGRDDLHITEMGAAINARMGLNSWAAFAGTDAEAQVAGDFAMRESEVAAVLKALRSRGINIVAIHHHMLGTQPVVIFLHYWGRGSAAKLAEAFRAALDATGK